MGNDIKDLQSELREFSAAREWEQFHSPKNLAASISIEAAEIMEHFQWLSDEQSRQLSDDLKAKVGEEVADVFLYLLLLSDKLGIDPIKAAKSKIAKNGKKYPPQLAKGNHKKYTEF
jgi:NTP pyrophosphatase (non-canonical NTP hydrolase)